MIYKAAIDILEGFRWRLFLRLPKHQTAFLGYLLGALEFEVAHQLEIGYFFGFTSDTVATGELNVRHSPFTSARESATT